MTKGIFLVEQNNRIHFLNRLNQFTTLDSHEELLNNTKILDKLQLEQIKQKLNSDEYFIPFHKEIKLSTKIEGEYWLDCYLQKIQFNNQAAILVTARDITKYKQLEQNQEKIIAEQKLVSMICHELKTPLNTIALSSNLLNEYCDTWDSDKQRKYLNRIIRNVNTLNLLIDEWLVLKKVELGKLSINFEALDIKDFCKNLLLDIQLDISGETESTGNIIFQQKINFICPEDNLLILTDSSILQLILTNLLENALKYSPKDSLIDLIVDYTSDNLYFQIIDRGIGICEKDLERLFEPFFRGNNIDDTQGHGLGLTIVKKLVHILKGEIYISSKVGLGTECKIIFPKIKSK